MWQWDHHTSWHVTWHKTFISRPESVSFHISYWIVSRVWNSIVSRPHSHCERTPVPMKWKWNGSAGNESARISRYRIGQSTRGCSLGFILVVRRVNAAWYEMLQIFGYGQRRIGSLACFWTCMDRRRIFFFDYVNVYQLLTKVSAAWS